MGEANGPVDIEELMEVMDDDTELLQECFDDFLEEADDMLAQIGKSIDEGDSAALDESAHKLKGTLKYLAAGPASDAAYLLEKMGKDDNMGSAGEVFQTLVRECDALKVFMKNYSA
ncbi:MAG: Hpt domain-containing protein [Desulfobacterales bacterium]|nr:Hpt domain-containing protein [Desulfobacterales bacterium]